MNNINIGLINKIFDCDDGHKVLLCKNNPSEKKEYVCLVCDNVVSTNEDNPSNVIYTDKTGLDFINSLSRIKYEFLKQYFENDANIEKTVEVINSHKK